MCPNGHVTNTATDSATNTKAPIPPKDCSDPNNEGESERIYRLYPRRIGKPKALASIQKAIAKEGFQKIESATKRFALSWHGKTDLTYCPHPTTWFNQERYNDESEVVEKPITEMSEAEYQMYIEAGLSKSCV